MKTIFRHLTAMLVAAILLLTVGCGTENKNSDTKNDTAQTDATNLTQLVVNFDEPYGASYQDKGGSELTVGDLKIQFTSEITEEARNSAVDEIIRVMALVEDPLDTVDALCEIRIRKGNYTPWSYDHVLYIGYDNLKTQEFTIGLGQMLFGHEVNYGLCYGFGTALAQEAGYPTEDVAVTIEQALTLCESSPYHLDMNYACFVSNYADDETLPKVKAIAIDFYQSLSREERQKLLTDYSGELYRESLKQYLSDHGQKVCTNADLDGISFYPCGSQMRLAWEDEYASYYLYDSYAVKYPQYDQINDVVDYLNSGYENFRYIAAHYRLQAEEMERIAGHLELYYKEEKVPVLFIRDGTWENKAAGIFLNGEEIRIYAYSSYAHEYIHYLTRAGYTTDWLFELFTAYFTNRTGDEKIFWEWQCTKATFENSDPNNPKDAKRCALFAGVQEKLGHSFDWASIDDTNCLKDSIIVAYNQFGMLKDNSYGAAARESFARYLATEYGEEAMLQAVYYDTPSEVFGKNWDELISDWQVRLISDYSWILQYTKGY